MLFGVRPEKVQVSRRQPDGRRQRRPGRGARRVLPRGQPRSYLVDMPSGTTWSCYEQNLDVDPIDVRPGDEVWLTWNPGHAFGVPRRTPHGHRRTCGAPTPHERGRVLRRLSSRPAGEGRAGRRTCCSCPGVLWLGVFFILPLVQLAAVSLQCRFPGFPGYYYRDLNFRNYASRPDRLRPALRAGRSSTPAWPPSSRSPWPTRWPTPWRSRPGRWRNLMMICVIAPFFTSFILRTFAWSQILADEGWVGGHPQLPPPAARWPHHQHPGRGGRGPDLQLPAVHGAADLRLARAGRPARHRGRRRPLRQRLHDLPDGDVADLACRASWPARCSPSSRRPATSSTWSCSAPSAGEDDRQRHQRASSSPSPAATRSRRRCRSPSWPRSSSWSSSTSAASAPRSWCECDDDHPTARPARASRPGRTPTRAQVWLANHFAIITAVLVLLYLFLPVAYTFAFSFNDHGKTNIVWQGFTWKHWQDPCGVAGRVRVAGRPRCRSASSPRSSPRCSAR